MGKYGEKTYLLNSSCPLRLLIQRKIISNILLFSGFLAICPAKVVRLIFASSPGRRATGNASATAPACTPPNIRIFLSISAIGATCYKGESHT
jgi:hypothetical protein